jgi:ribosome-associated heat shock protein Hsp15
MNTKREPVPVDTWLWAARLVKTRAQAVEAIEAGHVHVNGSTVAVGATVAVGDTLELQVGEARIAVDVRGVANLRGPERIAQRLYAETDESAESSDQQALERRAAVPRLSAAQAAAGSTKRDRRVSEQSANSRRVAPRGGGGRGR